MCPCSLQGGSVLCKTGAAFGWGPCRSSGLPRRVTGWDLIPQQLHVCLAGFRVSWPLKSGPHLIKVREPLGPALEAEPS